ncbi:uncharacterized protein PHALS_04759 [Plasmopara halstedii]|uniref:Uncharacterized protein n=1 Tax=Plasmopara halstedii TaxID=4781 RepID=A0A0P1B0V9_PLAHL|nr:uncharacterized protein PHALS_04759 [Plasmopara halstedii]CEG47609.1 hypothetical protein PHALS_04759 [Plasmopara halstedii]|eukprot:XP_024583978.1 hypothetical protein PHALS_04759 [Plasmopara halstedii]
MAYYFLQSVETDKLRNKADTLPAGLTKQHAFRSRTYVNDYCTCATASSAENPNNYSPISSGDERIMEPQ